MPEELFAEKEEPRTFLDGLKKEDTKKEEKPTEIEDDIDWLSEEPTKQQPKEEQSHDDIFDDDDADDDGVDDDAFQSKPKKNKKLQVAELRKSRDEALEKIKELQGKIDGLSEKGLVGEDFDPVAQLIKEKYDGDPKKLVEAMSISNNRLKELEDSLNNEKNRVRSLEITQSDEWSKEVAKPIANAQDDVYAAIAGAFIRKGENGIMVEHRELFDPFVASVISDKGPENAIELKAMLREFSSNFKKRTGEDFELGGTTREVISALSAIKETKQKGLKLYKEWEKERESLASKHQEEEFETNKKRTEQLKRSFKEGTSKAYQNFDTESLGDAIPSSMVKDAFLDSYNHAVEITENPSKAPEWSEAVAVTAKGRMFDKLLEAYKKASQELQEYKDSNSDGLRGSRRVVSNGKEDVDWLS